jgi:hypothetical protein
MVHHKDDIKNIIILLLIFTLAWQLYDFTYKARYGDFLKNIHVADVPYEVKCFFGEENCDEGDIDGWSLISLVVYFIIGYLVPNQYLFIIAISILFEISKPIFGSNAKIIVDPLINLTGYAIGSLLSGRKNTYQNKYELFVTNSYRNGLEVDKMDDKLDLACMYDSVLPRSPDHQGTVSSICYTDLVDAYVDPRERLDYFSEADGDIKRVAYAAVHHDVLEEEMI